MLTVAGLGVQRGGTWLLRGLDLAVAAGEMVAVLGPSGCGKTSLLRTLAGLDQPGEGTVAKPQSTAFLLQDHGLPGDLSLFDAVRTGCLPRQRALRSLFALPGASERRRAWHELEALGLTGCARRKIRHVSGGERQRAALARLLVAGGDLLLADEPVANLDGAAAVLALGRLRAAAESGAAVLVVLHQPELAHRCCNRSIDLGVVRDG